MSSFLLISMLFTEHRQNRMLYFGVFEASKKKKSKRNCGKSKHSLKFFRAFFFTIVKKLNDSAFVSFFF